MDPELAQRIKSIISWPAPEQQIQDGARLIPDELVDSLGCYGDQDVVAERLAEYVTAGISSPTVSNPSKDTIDFLVKDF